MDQKIQEELHETIVDFQSFESNSDFHIEGRGIFEIKEIEKQTKEKLLITLRGDIIITTPTKIWQRVETIIFRATDIFPGNREDFLFTTGQFKFEGEWEGGIKNHVAQHMLHIKKDTGLGEDDLKRLNALKYKNVLSDEDKSFVERTETTRAAHRLKIVEELHTFLNSWKKTASEIELF